LQTKDETGKAHFFNFLSQALPEQIPYGKPGTQFLTRDEVLADVVDGMRHAMMTVRISYVLLLICCMAVS
jgi:hypothetical protein